MKVGIITTLGSKGQIVTPADYRKTLWIFAGSPLSISLLGHSVYIESVSIEPKSVEDNAAYMGLATTGPKLIKEEERLS